MVGRLRRHALQREFGWHVRGVQRVVVEVAAGHPAELIGAAFDQIDAQAAGRLPDILAGSGDLNLFEIYAIAARPSVPTSKSNLVWGTFTRAQRLSKQYRQAMRVR